MLRFHGKSLNKFSEIITNRKDVLASTWWGWRYWADKINANVVPWRYHGNRMELWSYSVDLSPTSLADITFFDLHKIVILVKAILLFLIYSITWKPTICLTSFVIPGHINRSVILDSVFFLPMCPEVGWVWHESMIFLLSCKLMIKRTYKFINSYQCINFKLHSVHLSTN